MKYFLTLGCVRAQSLVCLPNSGAKDLDDSRMESKVVDIARY